MFNLQGQVETLKMENEDYNFSEKIFFDEYTGRIDPERSTYSSLGSARDYSFKRIEQTFDEEAVA